jgi:hypothetical protein
MALDNYGNLKASVIAWSHVTNLGPVFDDILTMVENDIYSSGSRKLRVKEMQSRATEATPTLDRFLALPTDYLAMRRIDIVLDDFNCEVTYKAPTALLVQTSQAQPATFTITSQIEFNRPADQAYALEVAYYRKLAALTSAAPTNDILTNYPNVYFFGCMAAAQTFAGEVDLATVWAQKFADVIGEINDSDQDGQYGPAPTETMMDPIP